ncbi:MAG: crotonobetainyl-CoA:carnitine CoA-transferase CaiB-like acyl-CoA transferase [Acidimicrobiales bacterium]|jgi:crotonobetainyl-CoA:carnitine CoA-transferase CaiB-like acyl-CoA transferase
MQPSNPLLSNTRVIDFSDERGALAGLVLAQLGAEVVMVEPPEGAAIRHCPPFAADQPDLDGSLHHLGFSRGKSSVTVDWRTPGGADELHAMLAAADAVVLSGSRGEHERLGLPAPSELVERYPQLVVANVSGFGLTGPKADWADSDLVCGAAGFQQSVTGDYDRPPLRTSVPQVFHHAAADAAVGVLIALAERGTSGRGQLIDLSAQESWTWAGFYLAYSSAWGAPLSHRCGAAPKTGPLTTRFDFPASDGFVTITLMLGAAVGPFTNRLVEWMAQENACEDDLTATDWASFDPFSEPERLDRLNDAVGEFTAKRTRQELMTAARERRLLLAPVLTMADVLEADQFSVRNLWRTIDLPDGRRIKTPGPIAQTSPDPLSELEPAPSLGAHTAPSHWTPRPLPAKGDAAKETQPALPLDGLRVLDLSTSYAGPLIGRTLANFGATVVKVESAQRPDLARTAPPFLGEGFETSAAYAHTNAGKWSMALDLSKGDRGPDDQPRSVLRDLAAWADLIVDAYAPGALARMGLDRATLTEINPRAVVLQTSMLGQTGPLADVPGYGNMATALTGFFATTGWPDRGPVGPVGAYTDMISPRFATAVALAAVHRQRQTGQGMWIDLGQGESCLQLLTVGFLDTQANGRSWETIGNSDHFLSPQGVFPAAGNDQWVAVTCSDDNQWRALAVEIGRPDLAHLDADERRRRQAEIDQLISAWTARLDPTVAQERLQSVGVAGHQVQNSPECLADPQLAARGGWTVDAAHPTMGRIPVGAPPIRMSRTPGQVSGAGPTLGQHTFEVLNELLGYDTDRIADLAAAEILE